MNNLEERKGHRSRDLREAVSLRSGLSTFPLDDELVVLCEETQCLVGLNRSAAFVFRALQRGATQEHIERTFRNAGLAPANEATQWVADAIEGLEARGLLTGSPPPDVPKAAAGSVEPAAAPEQEIPPFAPYEVALERRYRLLNTSVLVRVAHKGQLRLIDAILGHLASDETEEPTVIIDVQAIFQSDGHLASNIYRDEQPIGYASKLSRLGPIVKSAVWQSAVNAYDFVFYIHAGVVARDGSCVILPASAGSGKSTLTAALTHGGFRYYSDEVALITRETFRIPPMPLAICSKKNGWKVMQRYYPGIWDVPLHLREDRRYVRYLPPPPGAVEQPAIPVTHMVFPRYTANSSTELTPLTRAEAFGRLMSECLALRERLAPENVASMVRWLSAIDCFSLAYSNLDEAVSTVRDVVSPQRR